MLSRKEYNERLWRSQHGDESAALSEDDLPGEDDVLGEDDTPSEEDLARMKSWDP